MKRTTKLLTMTLAAVMAACTLTACGGSSKGDALTFGTNAEFPPFEYVTSMVRSASMTGLTWPLQSRSRRTTA